MMSKKFLVAGLVLTLLASGGSVYASQEPSVSAVTGEATVVSEVGKPYAIIGDTRFEYVPGKVTVDELSAYFKSLKVVDSGGNDLGMSDQLASLDAKCKARSLESEVAYLNEADGIIGSKGFIVGLEDYTYVALMVDCMPISESESSFPVINIANGGFHFYKGQTITAEDLLSKISVVDSSGKENDELKKSILFDSIHLSNPDTLRRLSAEEAAAFINKTIASCGYENLKEDFFYIGVYVDDSNYKTADVFAARAYFDAEAPSEITGNIVYSTHVQNVGWQKGVADGKMSGTEGRGLRLEGITIQSGIDGVGVSYTTHVQNIGWQDPVADGKTSGTSGRGLRLEGIRINLTGEKADQYDVVYRVHAQNVGWMGYALNGADAGTAGYGYRLEGIEIQIVEKGTFTGDTENAFRDAQVENAWKKLYLSKLAEIQKADTVNNIDYALCDMNGDGVSELIVNTIPSDNYIGICSFYKISDDGTSVQKLNDDGNVCDGVASVGGYRAFLRIPADGNGLYATSFYSVKPEIDVNRVTISGNDLIETDVKTLMMKTDEQKAFYNANPAVEWFDIDNTAVLS